MSEKTVKTAAEQSAPAAQAAPAEKTVKIHLFKDNARYSGDVFVGVNGKNYKIQRGVDVEVPESVAEVLEHSQVQDSLTAARAEAAQQLVK